VSSSAPRALRGVSQHRHCAADGCAGCRRRARWTIAGESDFELRSPARVIAAPAAVLGLRAGEEMNRCVFIDRHGARSLGSVDAEVISRDALADQSASRWMRFARGCAGPEGGRSRCEVATPRRRRGRCRDAATRSTAPCARRSATSCSGTSIVPVGCRTRGEPGGWRRGPLDCWWMAAGRVCFGLCSRPAPTARRRSGAGGG